MTRMRMAVLGAIVVGLGGIIYLAERTSAGENKALVGQVTKIAELIKKGDKDGADKAAQAFAKKLDSLEEVMHLFKPRKKGGLGVGKPGEVTPDGIELKIVQMKRDAPTPTTLKKEAAALEEMGYLTAAIAAITKHAAHTNDKAKKGGKDWIEWSVEMQEASVKLAQAAKAQGGQELKTATSKVDGACNACHSKYR